eukprot:COSAG01_NODE_602_length_14953_cov_60.675980_11_plen_471_part_00
MAAQPPQRPCSLNIKERLDQGDLKSEGQEAVVSGDMKCELDGSLAVVAAGICTQRGGDFRGPALPVQDRVSVFCFVDVDGENWEDSEIVVDKDQARCPGAVKVSLQQKQVWSWKEVWDKYVSEGERTDRRDRFYGAEYHDKGQLGDPDVPFNPPHTIPVRGELAATASVGGFARLDFTNGDDWFGMVLYVPPLCGVCVDEQGLWTRLHMPRRMDDMYQRFRSLCGSDELFCQQMEIWCQQLEYSRQQLEYSRQQQSREITNSPSRKRKHEDTATVTATQVAVVNSAATAGGPPVPPSSPPTTAAPAAPAAAAAPARSAKGRKQKLPACDKMWHCTMCFLTEPDTPAYKAYEKSDSLGKHIKGGHRQKPCAKWDGVEDAKGRCTSVLFVGVKHDGEGKQYFGLCMCGKSPCQGENSEWTRHPEAAAWQERMTDRFPRVSESICNVAAPLSNPWRPYQPSTFTQPLSNLVNK